MKTLRGAAMEIPGVQRRRQHGQRECAVGVGNMVMRVLKWGRGGGLVGVDVCEVLRAVRTRRSTGPCAGMTMGRLSEVGLAMWERWAAVVWAPCGDTA
jgi:hypothetical protein